MQRLDTTDLIHYTELDSTQLEARRLIMSGKALHGQIIIADIQTAGYGRRSRKWYSGSGNIAMTVILKPNGDHNFYSQLCYVAALALGGALISLIGETEVCFKWVNDVLIYDKKIAGIILERVEHDFVLIGIGLNLIASKPLKMLHAISLEELHVKIDSSQFIEILTNKVQYFYNLWVEHGFAPIKSQWLIRALGIDQQLTVQTLKEKHEGIFIGIDDYGNLLLMQDAKINSIAVGELFF